MTSEEQFGIVDQPGCTCSFIDQAIDGAHCTEQIVNELEAEWEKVDEDSLEEVLTFSCSVITAFISIRDKCFEIVTGSEDARSNVIAIRDWGQEWKEKAKKFHDCQTDAERYLRLIASRDAEIHERDMHILQFEEHVDDLTRQIEELETVGKV